MGKVEVGEAQQKVWKDYWENYYMGPERTQFLRKRTDICDCMCVKNGDVVEQFSLLANVASFIDDAMEVAFNLGWEAHKKELEEIHKELRKKRID